MCSFDTTSSAPTSPATDGLVRLTQDNLPQLRRLLRADPATNVFVDHRVETTRLDPRWFGGEMWGWVEDDELVSALHYGANVVPVDATPAALDAFAQEAAGRDRTCGSIVGPRDAVLSMWETLEPCWAPAREVRADQPFMRIDDDPPIPSHPGIRQVVLDELDTLYPAAVAMYTEEVGVSPETDSGHYYRARVAQLITRGWAFAWFEDGRVIFKAELGAATSRACQVQGVWIDPEYRGRGLAAPCMAGVVRLARERVAPIVTLYVNDHNQPAYRSYLRSGFQRTGTFATILF